ncbi:unnamed protein product, partial [Polarella glacialis]
DTVSRALAVSQSRGFVDGDDGAGSSQSGDENELEPAIIDSPRSHLCGGCNFGVSSSPSGAVFPASPAPSRSPRALNGSFTEADEELLRYLEGKSDGKPPLVRL